MASKRKGELIDYSTAHDDRAKMAEYLQSSGVRQIGNDPQGNQDLQKNRIVFIIVSFLLLGTGLFFAVF